MLEDNQLNDSDKCGDRITLSFYIDSPVVLGIG